MNTITHFHSVIHSTHSIPHTPHSLWRIMCPWLSSIFEDVTRVDSHFGQTLITSELVSLFEHRPESSCSFFYWYIDTLRLDYLS
ncbi:MAG: ribulose-1,5-bisphosphate carboxylase/oxygenase large subunit [Circular genetic element sp.]|nr:MAG: ribulose-1,5-bisphosphate carboxylase/oxygenase large subunit [Circular genetic element sp.]